MAPKWDLSACFCLLCATFYQLMNRAGEPSRNGHLRLAKCRFCLEDEQLLRPPNTTHTKYLRRWIEQRFREHRPYARSKRKTVAPSVIIVAVHPDGRIAKITGPAWLGLAKGNLFRMTHSDPRISKGPLIVVPERLAGRGDWRMNVAEKRPAIWVPPGVSV